ncbi:iwsip-like protein [Cryptosporidium ryanae]|uniref:iwsip-like protein n=1 Tax=Cryptosporidium ryanae TaxID=515981 RepID=UPI00351A52D6|nr:iwsip-like protein [Cryptosporidium ryanae]
MGKENSPYKEPCLKSNIKFEANLLEDKTSESINDNSIQPKVRKKRRKTDIVLSPNFLKNSDTSIVGKEILSSENKTQLDEFLVNDESSDFDEDDIIPVEGGILSSEDDNNNKTKNVSRKFGGNMHKSISGRHVSEIDMRVKVRNFVQKMNEAASDDEKAYQDGKKAMFKLKMLDEVLEKVSMSNLTTYFISEGVVEVLCRWLRPFNDGTLPSLSIRNNILKLICNMSLTEEDIVSTEIGKVVCELWKNPAETQENRQMIRSLMQRWMKLISKTRNNESDEFNGVPVCTLNNESSGEQKEGKPGKSVLYVEPRTARIPVNTGYNFRITPQNDDSSIQSNVQVSAEKQVGIISKKGKNKTKHAMRVSLEGRGL